jgi:LuxR family transcriptional regulator, maltose regulon positive regulatory protein
LNTSAEQFNPPLIKTKLSAPQLRAGLVARPALLGQLKKSVLNPFLLLCAPAGYGKTTLLINWIAELKQASEGGNPSVCWLSLGEEDNDPVRFLNYLLASFETAGLATNVDAHAMLQASPSLEIRAVLAVLINDLENTGAPLFIILDDYQSITNSAVHAGMTFFLDHLPLNVHVIIATRSDPPIPLARLRARGQMDEIRAVDLRFTYGETECLFNQLMGLGLAPEDMVRLDERTEGWIAGLQMAALALKGIAQTDHSKISQFVKNFSGSNRYILDYLMEEVLNHQPQEIQDFLLQTSILENLSGSLCDALIGIRSRKPAEGAHTSQEILEYLDRSNLFLVTLDSERQWYRYHNLFASLLRSRLKQSMEPAKVHELYRRAGQWYESKGLLAEAITQALASPDPGYASEILQKNILSFFYQSEIMQVHRWLEALPEDYLIQQPLLCAVHAATIALLPPYPPKSLAAAEKWMQAAEAGLPETARDCDLVRTFIYSIRSYWAYFRGELPEAVLQLIEKGLALLPTEECGPITDQDFIRSALQTLMGLAYWTAGEDEIARQTFIKARAISHACNDYLNETASVIQLIHIYICMGQPDEAVTLCREALAGFERQKAALGHRTPHSAMIGIQLAEILIEKNKLGEVEQLLQDSIQLARWTVSHDILVRGHLDFARLEAIRGNSRAAFDHLAEAESVSEFGAGLAGAQRATLWLALGANNPEYLSLARQWGQNYSLVEFKQGPPLMEWVTSLALAHVYLAEAELIPSSKMRATWPRFSELMEWLERQEQAMRRRGWVYWETLLCVIECLARQVMGETPAALQALRRALELATPNGYSGMFLEEGERLRKILVELEPEAGELQLPIRSLLAAFPDTSRHPGLPVRAGEGLVEPLTAREVEILQAMAEGLSNRQIAEKFILAEGTVKFYVHAVLEKMGVHNRTQAVIEAKKQKMI